MSHEKTSLSSQSSGIDQRKHGDFVKTTSISVVGNRDLLSSFGHGHTPLEASHHSTLEPASTGAATGGGLSAMSPGLTLGTGPIQCRKKTEGDKFTEGMNAIPDLAGQVDAMKNMSLVLLDDKADPTENSAYMDYLQKFKNNEAMDEVFRQRIETSQQMVAYRDNLLEQGYEKDEADARTQYSPLASQLNSYDMLIYDMGMTKDPDNTGSKATAYYKSLATTHRQNNTDTHQQLSAAGDIYNLHPTLMTQKLGKDRYNEIKNTGLDEQAAAAKAWQRPRKPEKAKKPGLFQRLFGKG